jgi:hypothetical protein
MWGSNMSINKWYYLLKPFIPRVAQLFLRRNFVRLKMKKYHDVWPIDERAAIPPSGWAGWPEGKRFALVLTHSVDTARGAERCYALSNLEDSLGFRSSFNFVPERYKVQPDLRRYLVNKGFEVGVHDLNHDGKLYNSEMIFRERAEKINKYLEEWESVGFRSASMLHNLEWIGYLNIAYDASTFDTDPFEPQSDGMKTIFPFWVDGNGAREGYVEHPYTLPQDFTLFVWMQEKTIDVWKRKLDWIAEVGGMALLNTHPDYMNFKQEKLGLEDYPAEYYIEFLEYVEKTYKGQFWHALPREVSSFSLKNFRK